MLHYTLKRDVSGTITIDAKMEFDSPADAIEALGKLESFVVKQTLDNELLPFMKLGNHLQAVKHYKDKTGLGLKESKEYCDALRDKFRAMGLIPKD